MYTRKQHIVRKTTIVLASFFIGIVSTVFAIATYDATIQSRATSMFNTIKSNASAMDPQDVSAYYNLVHLNILSLIQVLTVLDTSITKEIIATTGLGEDDIIDQITNNGTDTPNSSSPVAPNDNPGTSTPTVTTHSPLTTALYANNVLLSNNSVVERNADGYINWRWESSVACMLNGTLVAKTGSKGERFSANYGSYLCYDTNSNTRKNIEFTVRDRTQVNQNPGGATGNQPGITTISTYWVAVSEGRTLCTQIGGGNIGSDSRISSSQCNIGDVVYQRTNCTQGDIQDRVNYMWTNYECKSTSANGSAGQTDAQIAAQRQAQLAKEAEARRIEEARQQALVAARAAEEAARIGQLRLNGGVNYELAKPCGTAAAVLSNESIKAYADRTGNICDIRLCLPGRILSSDGRNCIDQSLVGSIDKEKYHSQNLAVKLGNDGKPGMIGIYDGKGILLTNVTFNPLEIIKGLEMYNVDRSQLKTLADLLDTAEISYMPYEMYPGTGSDAGIDLRDLANGGNGRGNAGTGIDCTKLAQQITSKGVMKWAICSKGIASWYMTQAEAAAAQKIYGGTIQYLAPRASDGQW